MDINRYRELRKLPKSVLVAMHIANGGLMTRKEYMGWTKDELVSAVLEDEARKPVTNGK